MMAKDAKDLIARLHTAAQVLEIFLEEHLERSSPNAPTITQLLFLARLYRLDKSNLPIKDIRRHCYGSSNIAYLIEKLQKRGLLTRTENKENKRETNLVLTAKGKEFASKASAVLDLIEDDLGKYFPAAVAAEINRWVEQHNTTPRTDRSVA